jgi:hypothetical protein
MQVIATEKREYVAGKFLREIWEIIAAEWKARNSALKRETLR